LRVVIDVGGVMAAYVAIALTTLFFTPGKDPVPIVQETGWAPGPV